MALILKNFADATLATEGHTSSIDLTLLSMDFLLDKFEQAKDEYATDPFLSPCINAGWKKLEKYYSITDRTPAYSAALVLCPRFKWMYFEQEWPAEWVQVAKDQVQELWLSQYKNNAVSDAVLEVEDVAVGKGNTSNEFLQWQARKVIKETVYDEYIHYCQAPIINGTDSRVWWLEPTQRKMYPNLSIMALDLLAIPSMSAEPERLFSGAKITITDRRNRLGIDAINATECCKSWFKKAYVLPFVDDELSMMTDILLVEEATILD
jgi:hypothetical protein